MNLSSRYLHFEHRPVHFNVDDRHFNDAFEFPLADWNDVVETQVSMSKWLKNNGLRKHCLCMEQIVSLMRDGEYEFCTLKNYIFFMCFVYMDMFFEYF